MRVCVLQNKLVADLSSGFNVVLFCILYFLTLNPSLVARRNISLMPMRLSDVCTKPEKGEDLIPATLFLKFDF